jgi:hypothetical protein
MKKWTDFYNTEEELIEDMLITYTNPKHDLDKLCYGYKYINTFKEYWFKHDTLTPNQMVYIKRLAADIYENVHVTQGR